MHKRQAWAMVLQPRSKKVTVTPEAQRIATRMHNALKGITPALPSGAFPMPKGGGGGGGAAAASGEGTPWGIGGWLSLHNSYPTEPSTVGWFSPQGDLNDIPMI